jgi:ABC-type proline/glycine betaine transport system permease subunit
MPSGRLIITRFGQHLNEEANRISILSHLSFFQTFPLVAFFYLAILANGLP